VAPVARSRDGRGFELEASVDAPVQPGSYVELETAGAAVLGQVIESRMELREGPEVVSSSEHGYMKPHPSIFQAAMTLVGAAPEASVMVGDSLTHDIAGARRAGMRGVLVHRSDAPAPETDVPVIRTLTELPELL